MNRHSPRSSSFAQKCADTYGYDVKMLKKCIDNPDVLERMWKRKVDDRHQGFWVSVSPYLSVNGEHIPRIEEIPRCICERVGMEKEACQNMPHLSEGRGYCMIKVIH